MQSPRIPDDESRRLAELYSYEILDSEEDDEYDRVLELAMLITDTPMGTITFVDRGRQWFKSRRGVDAPETARDISFCGHGILTDDLFVVEDAHRDQRFYDNPLVLGGPRVVFYAGMPLVNANGHHLGMLCVQDHRPRTLTDVQRETLRKLAGNVMALLELRRVRAQNAALQREVQHRVQNTLQFLASLLHLLRSEPDRDADDVLSEFGSRLRSMADVTRYFDSLVQSTTTELDDHVAGMLTNLLCPGHTFTLPEDDPIVRSDVAMRMLSLVYELSLVIHFVDPAAELHVMIRVDDEQLSFDARTSVDRSEVTRIVDVGGLGGPVARSDPREAFVDSQPTDAGVVLRFRFPATGEQQPDRNHEAGSA